MNRDGAASAVLRLRGLSLPLPKETRPGSWGVGEPGVACTGVVPRRLVWPLVGGASNECAQTL